MIGTQVNVEIQVDMTKYSEKRDLVYWSKLYLNAMEKGEDYDKARKTICIWILDGEKYEFEKYHSKWHITEDELREKGYFSDLEIHIIELKKFKKLDIMKPKKKEFWLWFLDYSRGEMVKMGCERYKEIKAAKEKLDKILATEPAIREMIIQDEMNELTENTLRHRKEEQAQRIREGIKELREGRRELREGKKELEEGEKRLEENKKELEEQQEKINNTIRKMKEKGLTTEEIKELTNLSEEEINKIIKHQN